MSQPENHPEKLNDLLKVSEAASILGVSVSTLRNWDRSGKLKAKRHPINGYRLYSRTELRRVMDDVLRAPEGQGGAG